MKTIITFLALVTVLVLVISGQQVKQDRALSVSQFNQDDLRGSSIPDDARKSFIQRADPNESAPDIATAYFQARELIIKGDWDQAKALLEKAIGKFPESRHLHNQLAQLLWYFYNDRTKNRATLEQSIKEGVRAFDIGFLFLKVDYEMTDLLARGLGEAGDVETLDRVFTKAFALDSNCLVYLDYAHGLNLMSDSRAADAFREAMDREPEGTYSARIEFSEWLLDHGGETEVVDLLAKSPAPYLHFLRGVALERLNRLDEAREDYKSFAEFSRSYPASARFKILGSVIQSKSGIKFEVNEKTNINNSLDNMSVTAAVTTDQTIKGLASLIFREAGAESIGGMNAVGWEVRSRVLRGSVGSPSCPYVENSGSTLADQYKAVMCQGNGSQFNGMCLAWCSNPGTTSCPTSTQAKNAASGVYNGTAPDPVSGHCPGNISSWGGSYCADTTVCRGNKTTYRVAGPLFNYGTRLSCPTLCAPTSSGKKCSNSNSDNCFYANPIYCTGSKCVTDAGSLSTAGTFYNGTPFNSSSGTHKGHLEGPESSANQDFDLYLDKGNSSTGPWQNVANSSDVSAVEDITYTGTSGYYRWRVKAFRGTGSFKLYSKRP
jgi:tetratricopeptide (TPR) repeat protein